MEPPTKREEDGGQQTCTTARHADHDQPSPAEQLSTTDQHQPASSPPSSSDLAEHITANTIDAHDTSHGAALAGANAISQDARAAAGGVGVAGPASVELPNERIRADESGCQDATSSEPAAEAEASWALKAIRHPPLAKYPSEYRILIQDANGPCSFISLVNILLVGNLSQRERDMKECLG